MQVLILGDDHGQQARLAGAMMKKGFQVMCVESATAASSYIRSEMIDVLILIETLSSRISQSSACAAQSRNRAVSVIVISGRTGAALEELFEQVPLLYGVMGLDMAPSTVAALALASILPQQVGMAMPLRPVGADTDPVPQVAVAAFHSVAAVNPPPVAPLIGQPAPLSRRLIQPLHRPAPVTPPPDSLAALDFVVPAIVPDRPLRQFVGPQGQAAKDAELGPDMAALERELDLVNRDRPSVLAASIADELPRWSQTAPKLAMLTDWSRSDATDPAAAAAAKLALPKAQTERRLALGVTLQ